MQDLIDQYKRDGVVCIRNAFEKEWLKKIAIDVDRILANPNGVTADQSIASDTGRFFNGFFQWLRNDGIKDFVLNSPASGLMSQLMESAEIQYFYDQLLVKEPGTSQRTPWHTDADYFPIKGKKIASIWLPLDPVTQESGTLRFIKGSHQTPLAELVERVPKKISRDQNKGMYVLPDFDEYPDLFDFQSWDLEPGDCLIFQIDIVHFAYGNMSKNRRRALSTRWFGEGCRVDESQPHILNKPNIKSFIESCGFQWNGRLDNALFPKFPPKA